MRVMSKWSDDTYLLLNEDESKAYFPSFTGFIVQMVLAFVGLCITLGIIWLFGVILSWLVGCN